MGYVRLPPTHPACRCLPHGRQQLVDGVCLPLHALPPAAADSSVKMVFEPQPQPRIVAALNEKTVTQVGSGHCCAVLLQLLCCSAPGVVHQHRHPAGTYGS